MKSLNHVFRTIWSDALGAWIAVSEITKSKGKRTSSSLVRTLRIASINPVSNGSITVRLKQVVVALILSLVGSAYANPIGGSVANGQASFNTTGNTLTVTNTPGTIINWQNFSIQSNEITRFVQQSAASAVLNRVVTNNPSQILGSLQSNGRVFLVNPNGIVFGAGSTINVAGLVATTLNLSDSGFISGNYNLTGGTSSTGNISNAGSITAQSGGQIYLIAPNVENSGIISAPNGEIFLAAGNNALLVNSQDPNLAVSITAPAGNVTNVGQLVASAGNLGLIGALVSNTGAVSADSATMQGGNIIFKASQSAQVGGTVSANGTSGGSVSISAAPSTDPTALSVVIQTGTIQAQGSAGAGGTVNISGDSILSAASINVNGTTSGGSISVQANDFALSTTSAQYAANSSQGNGGDILVLADVSNYSSGSYSVTGSTGGNITIAGNEIKLAGTQFDASGVYGGGSINVGGLLHGAAGFSSQGVSLANATDVLTNSSTTFNADSLQSGNGGQVVLWSDQSMTFMGSISAKGGALGGNGGTAEVSGLTSFGYAGQVSLSASNGLNGTLLLDPQNITIVSGSTSTGVNATEFLDPQPSAGEGFGGNMTELASGNIVIASPGYNFVGTAGSVAGASAGAVFLFSPTGSLVSALTGAAAGDQVGSGGVTVLGNGNFVVVSPLWSNGTTAASAGAVTWGSSTAGISGVVSSSNSLVGSVAGDNVGSSGVFGLANGNYIVVSPNWSGVTSSSGLGAVTWGSGTAGVSGIVSSTNSLVGSTSYDHVGFGGVTSLSNGNYVVSSYEWSNGGTNLATSALGAVTWGSGTSGVSGAVSSSNSLVGDLAGDQVGSSGITEITNGTFDNYVVNSPIWHGSGVYGSGLGAVTWGDGSTGVFGIVSASNSLVGGHIGDSIGSGYITTLSNGNYVVVSTLWSNLGATPNAGAVTWGNGSTGISGTVSSSNSLVGSQANDYVGLGGVNSLENGNYVVDSPWWGANGVVANALGAVTWINGSTGKLADGSSAGFVSASNSLVGSTAGDQVGYYGGITYLTNGNYVVVSPNWTQPASLAPAVLQAGAVTWGNGATGTSGVVSSTNSLVGSTNYDQVGIGGVTPLINSNYVVNSYYWGNNGVTGPVAASALGAVTWGSGTAGVSGTISTANSLIGSASGDELGTGGVSQVYNGVFDNYVVKSPNWGSGGVAANGLGAVTWGSGTTGISGNVSSFNSLVGSTAGDQVGSGSYYLTVLSSGNYVVLSPNWNNGGNASAGAVTWGNGSTGVSGVVSPTNSLVGSVAGDAVGSGIVFELVNGNYVVVSSNWSGVTSSSGLGAVTWGNGTSGITGVVSSSNSLVGSTTGDQVGASGVFPLINGNYVVLSSTWNNGAATTAGAVTWGNGATGTSGVVSASNSLVGNATGDSVGSGGIVELFNSDYLVKSPSWINGTAISAGAVTWGNGATGTFGIVSSSNSLVGSSSGDQIGNGGITLLTNGNYVVDSYFWSNGGTPANGLGAVTWGSGTTGVSGVVSSTNSLVGNTAGDKVGSSISCPDGCSQGSGITTLFNGNYVVASEFWNGGGTGSTSSGMGAVTWGNGLGGTVGVVGAANSLVGSHAGDNFGGDVVVLNYTLGDVYVGASPAYKGAVGAGRAFILGATSGGTGTLFPDNPTGSLNIGANNIAAALNAGTNVDLQANTDIVQDSGAVITATTGSGNLILQAGRSVTLVDVVDIKGTLTITANDPGAVSADRTAGAASLIRRWPLLRQVRSA